MPAVGGTDLSSSFPCLEVCAVGAISSVLPLFDVLVRESDRSPHNAKSLGF